MGTVVSSLRGFYFGLKALISELRQNGAVFNRLLNRINTSPGLPVANPTQSFWLEDPLHPELVDIQSSSLPESADIIIIGSGITGAAVARALLLQGAKFGITKRIVLLEARQITSGATGRNGGHIKASAYEAYNQLKGKYGAERARKIVEFRMSHLELLIGLAKYEGWVEAECRAVETVDLFVDEKAWLDARKMVEELKRGMPDIAKDVKAWDGAAAREEFSTEEHVLGALSFPAGALWPYRFVTRAFSDLLARFPKAFSVETNTPVEAISTCGDTDRPYLVHTRRGTIASSHIIHATNAHAAALIPGLVGKVFPIRAQMTAQRPGQSFPVYGGARSWSFINEKGYDYVTQRPGTPDSGEGKGGEIMLGGGLFQAGEGGVEEIGIADDSKLNYYVGSYIGGVLPMIFGRYWGADVAAGRVKNMWTGVVAGTIDLLPFVGRLEPSLTKRHVPKQETSKAGVECKMPESGEWIAAGYSGDGMVNAWLCGTAVAMKVLGLDDVELEGEPGIPSGKVSDWLPDEFIISKKRLDKTSITELAGLL